MTLGAGRRYTFWLELGPTAAGSIERTETSVDLPQGVGRLVVLLLQSDGGFKVDGQSGEIELGPNGFASVGRQPGRIGTHGRPGCTSC